MVPDNAPVRPTMVDVGPGRIISARMPTAAERRRASLPEGVPVLVVDGQVYPADAYIVITQATVGG
jgi:hypothetical protein